MKNIVIISLAIFGALYSAEPESSARRILTNDALMRPSDKDYEHLLSIAPLIKNQASDYQGDIDLQETPITQESIQLMIDRAQDKARWESLIQRMAFNQWALHANQANFLLAEEYLGELVGGLEKKLERIAHDEQFKAIPEKILGTFMLTDDLREMIVRSMIKQPAIQQKYQRKHVLPARIFGTALSPSGDTLGLGILRKREEDPEEFFLPRRRQESEFVLIDTQDLSRTKTAFKTNFASSAASWSNNSTIAYNDGSRIVVRDLAHDRHIEYEIRKTPLKSVVFKPGSTQIALADLGKTVYLFDYSLKKVEQLIELRNRVNSLSFNKAGDQLAIGSDDGVLTILTMNNKKHDSFPDSQSALISVSFKPDGTAVAALYKNGHVLIWTGSVHKKLDGLRQIAGEGCIRWSPSGDYIAIARHDGSLEILDATTCTPIISHQASSREFADVSWSSNDQVAYAYRHGLFGILDVGRCVAIQQALAAIDDPSLLLFLQATQYGTLTLSKAQREFLDKRIGKIPSAQTRDLLWNWYQDSKPGTKHGTRRRSD